jgi:NADPH:quinone reductase-like Zn-dependent oxidoreductase
MLIAIGADHTIDYTNDDFSSTGVKYDVIFDTVYQSSFSKCLSALTADGCYLMANTSPLRMIRGLWCEWTTRRKVKFALARETEEDLSYLANLIAEKKIRPAIDRIYPLQETVEAHRYVEQGHKKGNVIIHC